MTVGYSVPAIVTGKPINIGGSKGRTEATGRGVIICMEEALRAHGYNDASKTSLIIQGFGNVGSHAAAYADELGFKIVGVSDIYGGIYNEKGLDIDSVRAHMAETGSLEGYKDAVHLTNDELLIMPCDVLIPAAMEGQLTKHNAPDIKARIIVEGANGPTTTEADDILEDRGIFVVPDILANAGGVIVSYFEWVQDLQAFFWDEDEIFHQLRRILIRSYDATLRAAEDHDVNMRMAAQIVAIQRVAEAVQTRGFYP